MWYFSWILGLGLAVAFAILNAMWLEVMEGGEAREEPPREEERPPRGRSAESAPPQ
jgi:cytochrome bd-I ubiquinol oxidase subunit X